MRFICFQLYIQIEGPLHGKRFCLKDLSRWLYNFYKAAGFGVVRVSSLPNGIG